MTTISLLLLLAGCTGSPADTDTSNVGDADTDADSDADSDADADVTFDIVLPMAATVTVDEIPIPCDDEFVCTVNAEGDGTFEVNVTHDIYYFIPKQVVVTGGVPDIATVTYATGGCPDADWDGTAWCPSGWTMSEYAVNITGEYCDQYDDCYEAVMGHGDLDDDGVEELTFEFDGFGGYFNVSGDELYSFDAGTPDGYGYMASGLSTIDFYYGGDEGNLHNIVMTRTD